MKTLAERGGDNSTSNKKENFFKNSGVSLLATPISLAIFFIKLCTHKA